MIFIKMKDLNDTLQERISQRNQQARKENLTRYSLKYTRKK